MGEKNKAPKLRPVSTMSPEQYQAEKAARAQRVAQQEMIARAQMAAQLQAEGYQFPVQQQYVPQGFQYTPQFAPNQEPLKIDRRKRRMPKFGKVVIGTVTGAAVITGIGVTGYHFNIGGFQDTISANFGAANGETTDNPDLGIEQLPLESIGIDSLAKGDCDKPESVLMIARISGEYPIVPLLATTENPTPAAVEPYMTESYSEGLPAKEQAVFSKFITESEYNNVELNELPMGLSVCIPPDVSAFSEEDGKIIINRDQLEVKIKDIDEIFMRNIIKPAYQEDGAGEEYVDADPAAGEFIIFPDPARNLFLGEGEDEVYNQHFKDLITNMNTPLQKQLLLATMERDAIESLVSTVDGQEGISYPDGIETFQKAIDLAIIKRIGGDSSKIQFENLYKVQPVVATDPATKKAITASNELKSIDTNQTFKISSIDVTFGPISEPAIEEPETTPSPTATPAPTTKP